MPIEVHCDECGSSFRVADEVAGRRGRCPRCKATILVPGSAAKVEKVAASAVEDDETGTYELAGAVNKARVRRTVTAPEPLQSAKESLKTQKTRTPHEILAAFRGEIPPIRSTWTYRLWILIVAVVMVILPMIYVGLAVAAALAVLWHATHNLVIFQNVRNARAALFLYAAPLVAGSFLVAFMFKPLFASPAKRTKRRELDPSKEPLLFAFVDGICQSVRAPVPTCIYVDCAVNASAALASGALSPRKRLELTIGLPLVAGLTLPQFAGVLAHEFGHFSQGAGMRLNTLIRSINVWFARVVYERDSWDETLDAWIEEGGYMFVIAVMTKLMVWLTRRILWVLMYVGAIVSSFLSRQQEFDADRYEARMVGAETFAATSLRLRELGLANQGAQADLGRCWQERRLPDDYPRLIVANIPQIPPPMLAMVREAALNSKTGLFDSHPCDKDRIAKAKRDNAAGIFHLQGPATDLFREFDSLSRATTYQHYRSVLGNAISKEQLVPVSDLIDTQAEAHQGSEAFDRLFLDAFSLVQPLPLNGELPRPPADPKAAKTGLIDARRTLAAAAEDNLAALGRWNEMTTKASTAAAALAMWRANGRPRPGDFDSHGRDRAEAEATIARCDASIQALHSSLEPFSNAAARRIELGLSLLELPAVQERIPDGAAIRDDARRAYPCASLLAKAVQEIPPAQRSASALARLLQKFHSGNNEKNEPLINAILRAGQTLNDDLTRFRSRLPIGIDYPFEHAREGMTIGKFILERVPDSKEIGELMDAISGASDRLFDLQKRCLGMLAVAVLEVEKALKLPPLERPEAEANAVGR
ncbi:M48 family metalloprotease [Paludisphaera rhizosphaerae]|uniref:M48 family metalloprotease n=1 Tax=Paludisphaera rhizosphaerae TaxID=2711216 RepID=UPI0013EC6B3C|nr:M48 family metalloprotease [Paludisphaera rhizosphaerae]